MIYLLHFERPYEHARHYLGFTRSSFSLSRRLEHHREGRGSKLTAAATRAGIEYSVVRTWEGDRLFERRLHSRRDNAYLCPVCREDRARRKLEWARRRREEGRVQ